jgi:hypothetical protein
MGKNQTRSWTKYVQNILVDYRKEKGNRRRKERTINIRDKNENAFYSEGI